MKSRTIAIILGLLIGQMIVVSVRSCKDHNRINEIIVDHNKQNFVIDSCFYVCAGLAEKAIDQTKEVIKQRDSLKKTLNKSGDTARNGPRKY